MFGLILISHDMLVDRLENCCLLSDLQYNCRLSHSTGYPLSVLAETIARVNIMSGVTRAVARDI